MSAGTRRLFAAADASLAAHTAMFGPRPRRDLAGLLAELDSSGLDGRGGAGFPVHRKFSAVARAAERGGAPVIVANGSEGEPLSAKDRTLLRAAPHLVIDGLMIAADALGASERHLVVTPASASAVEAALGERDDGGTVRVHVADHGFVGGEASALVAGLSGRPAVPADRRVRLSERGLRRRPTLVQNVETLAHLALIARFGAAWHRAVGRDADAGTRLVSVSSRDRQPAVFEVESGIRLGDLVAAGAPGVRVAAVLVGGYHGAWVTPEALDAPFSSRGLQSWGAVPGAGIVHVLSAGDCGVRVTAEILGYLAAASARQCGPCLNGLPALAESMRLLAAGRDTRAELHRLAGLVDGRGACSHPDGSVRMLRSALTVFADDAAAHAAGLCRAEEGVRP